MSVARTLPASLPRRFANAPRAVARTEAASFELVVAEAFALRLRGLAGLGADELVPLLFPRCRSLHTFGMRAAIDVVWLSRGNHGEGAVVAIDVGVEPRHLVRAPREVSRPRSAALELPAGDAETLGLTQRAGITFSPHGRAAALR